MSKEKTEEVEFDADAHRQDTADKAIVEGFKIIAESVEKMPMAPKTQEDKEQVKKVSSEMAQLLMESFIENKVPMSAMQYIAESMQSIMVRALQGVHHHEMELRQELASRVIGVRNPGTGDRYDDTFATIGDLMVSLDRVRGEQGGVANDYHVVGSEEEKEG